MAEGLRRAEQAHLREFLGNRAIATWDGYTDAMAERLVGAQRWLEERESELRRLIASSSADENAKQQRRQRLAALQQRRGVSLGERLYPLAGCIPVEKAHIAEREAYAGLQATTPEQAARKKANAEWLVERRQRVFRLAQNGNPHGWDEADRAVRYRNLSIATLHGQAYQDWKKARAEAERRERAREAERRDGLSPRGMALRWLSEHRGITEDPPGSNSDRRADGIRKAQVDCAGGGSFLIGQPWCGVWCFNALQAAGVPGINSRMAGVALIEDDARAGRGCYRGWTTNRSRVLRGDLVVIGGRGVHVETVRDVHADGSVTTDGGNTSPGRAGSQSNGGGAFLRRRFPSEITGFALVDYPDH